MPLALAAALLGCGDDDSGASEGPTGEATSDASEGTSAGVSTDASATETTGDASATETTGDATSDTDGDALAVDPGASRYALVGEEVVLDGSGSQGAALYEWFLDNGETVGPSPDPVVTVSYDAPGRRKPILTVYDEDNNKLSASVTISVTDPPVWTPRQSASVRWLGVGTRVAVVSPDSDELTLISGDPGAGFQVDGRLATAAGPRTLAPLLGPAEGWIAVAAQDADALEFFKPSESGDMTEEHYALALPRGARPYGVIAREGGGALVSLQATGQLAEVDFDGQGPPALITAHAAVTDARGVAALPDGRVAVTRWRSPTAYDDADATGHGEIAIVDLEGGAPGVIELQLDPQASSDTEIGGVPSYLDQLLVSPVGYVAALPSTQANIAEGAYRSGDPLVHDTTIRAVISQLELTGQNPGPAGSERFDERRQLDNRGLASAGAFSSRGDYLFITTRGSRTVERIDFLEDIQSGSVVDLGLAPQGVALAPDDGVIYVDAYMSRELVIYDTAAFSEPGEPLARLRIPSSEPLSATLLRGKQLFNDSLDTRLSKDGYMACAHCHLEGDADLLVWDFTDRGEGLRNTISMLGRAGMGDGPVHWSANFDEIQDFENDIRGPFGGLGLLDDADWEAGTRSHPMGDPKAGLSEDLDALAAYVASLETPQKSPYREQDGALTPAAQNGKTLFESPALGCVDCHAGPRLTDSAFLEPQVPLLHDVGTIKPSSGQR
ncbi:MAG: hypothetical protein KC468_12285, partial [Myxococcales bacterium]|nr:hypothetical protein [Myxococcales bacterium]